MRIALAFDEKELLSDLYKFRNYIEIKTGHTEWENAEVLIKFEKSKEKLIPLHPVTQYEGATQLSVGERVVGRESALCLGLSRVAPLRA